MAVIKDPETKGAQGLGRKLRVRNHGQKVSGLK